MVGKNVRWVIGGILAVLSIGLLWDTQTHAQDMRCFPEATGYCMQGRIRDFWEANGGLPVFGYPITPLQTEEVEGRMLQVQWFERHRLELHPENEPPYDVLMGRIGLQALEVRGQKWHAQARETPQEGCQFFPETGYNVCGAMLRAWQANGLELDGQTGSNATESLALYGLPVSSPRVETLHDGHTYTVQWFERVRFEEHTENVAPYDVLAGLLGTEVFGATQAKMPENTLDQKFNTPTPTIAYIPNNAPILKRKKKTRKTHNPDIPLDDPTPTPTPTERPLPPWRLAADVVTPTMVITGTHATPTSTPVVSGTVGTPTSMPVIPIVTVAPNPTQPTTATVAATPTVAEPPLTIATVSVNATATATPTPPMPTTTPSATATMTPTVAITMTATAEATATPRATNTATPVVDEATATPRATNTATPVVDEATATPRATNTATTTPTVVDEATATATPTAKATIEIVAIPVDDATATAETER